MKNLILLSCLAGLISCFAYCDKNEENTPPCNPEKVKEVRWTLDRFGSPDSLLSVDTLMAFGGAPYFIAHADSLFYAFDGCNTTDGKYILTDTCGIQFLNPGTTLAGCGPWVPTPQSIEANRKRREFILILVNGCTYSHDDQKLIIQTCDGRVAEFVK